MFGGNGVDMGNGVAVDPAGNVFVTGSASSTNFPTYNVPGLMSATNSGKSDAFVIAFTNTTATAAGTNLLYSGYLGGKDNDFGYGIAVDANDNAYVVGQTLSTNFPTFIRQLSQPQRHQRRLFDQNHADGAAAGNRNTTDKPDERGGFERDIQHLPELTTTDVAPPYFFQWQDGTNW